MTPVPRIPDEIRAFRDNVGFNRHTILVRNVPAFCCPPLYGFEIVRPRTPATGASAIPTQGLPVILAELHSITPQPMTAFAGMLLHLLPNNHAVSTAVQERFSPGRVGYCGIRFLPTSEQPLSNPSFSFRFSESNSLADSSQRNVGR